MTKIEIESLARADRAYIGGGTRWAGDQSKWTAKLRTPAGHEVVQSVAVLRGDFYLSEAEVRERLARHLAGDGSIRSRVDERNVLHLIDRRD